MNTKAGLIVQVASSFTSTPIERSLESAIVKAGVGKGVRFCQYEQIGQYMLGSASDSSEILGTIVLLRIEDWLRENSTAEPEQLGECGDNHSGWAPGCASHAALSRVSTPGSIDTGPLPWS